MEAYIKEKFPETRKQTAGKRVRIAAPALIRYADDLVILHSDLEVIKGCKAAMEEWLKDMGLELKPSKTKLTHTLEVYEGNVGFDFLGYHVRQYPVGKHRTGKKRNGESLGFKPLITPSKEKVKRHVQKLGEIVKRHQAAPQQALIAKLNPIIMGWSRYYSTQVSKDTFTTVDSIVYQQLRLKSNRTFYKPAPPHSGKRGAPRKDGAKLKLADSTTHQQPDGTWSGNDAKDHPVQVYWWENMHVRNARWHHLIVMKVVRPSATDKSRDPRVSWFVYIGQDLKDGISQVALAYGLRFGQEHEYRFDKQALHWTLPRLRKPEQFERWSQIVAIAHNLIVLARDFVAAELYPWENKQREPSLQQLRRGLGKILPQLGTPAPAPRLRGKSPGRPHGAEIRRSPRHPVVRKTVKVPQSVPT